MKKILFILLLLTTIANAQVKISELPNYTGTLPGTSVPIVVDGITRKIDASLFSAMKVDSVWISAGNLYVKKNGNVYNYTVTTNLSGYHLASHYDSVFLGLYAQSGYNKVQWDSAYAFTSTFSISNYFTGLDARYLKLGDTATAFYNYRIGINANTNNIAALISDSAYQASILATHTTNLSTHLSLINLLITDSAYQASLIAANTTAIAGKEPSIATGSTNYFWSWDKTWRQIAYSQISSTPNLSIYEQTANKGAANGYTPLGSDSKIPSSYMPALALNSVWTPSTQTAMLTLSSAVVGDVAIRSDSSLTYVLKASDYTKAYNWVQLLFPTAPVLSVAGMTGNVTLTTSNVSEGTNYYWTQTRFDNAFNAKSTSNLSEGTNLYFTTTRVNTQVATYTGDVTLSGTAFAIGSGKVTNTMLAGSIAASKLVGTDITLTESQITNLTTDLASKLAATITSASTGQLIRYNGSAWVNWTPTYLTSYTETDPIYTASSWYSTTNNSSNWNTAYGWGNHASAGYATASNTMTFTNKTWNGVAITDTYISSASTWNGKQAALSGTGFVKISGTTISYDNSTYITGNQTITLSGDVSGSGTTAITTAIGAGKVTNAMLAGSIDYAKMNSGTVPTWNQSTTGTAANVTLTSSTANLSFPLIAEYAGSLYYNAGTYINYSTGTLVVAGKGTFGDIISSNGTNGGFVITRRDNNANVWLTYSASGKFELYDAVNGVDRITVDNTGASTFISGTNGGAGTIIQNYNNSSAGSIYWGGATATVSNYVTYWDNTATIINSNSGTVNLRTQSIDRLTINNAGVITISSAINFGSYTYSSLSVGSIAYDTTYGVSLKGKAGSGYDFVLFNASGLGCLSLTTGTTTINTGGILNVGSTATTTNSTTGQALNVSGSIGVVGEIDAGNEIISKGTNSFLGFEDRAAVGTSARYGWYSTGGHAYLYYVGTSSNIFDISSSGAATFSNNLTVGGTGNFTGYLTASGGAGTSDIRLKTNIVYNPSISILDSIDFIQYNMKDNLSRLRYGNIAQQVEKYYPDLILTNDKGIKAIMYDDLQNIEIHELHEEVKELRKAITELQNSRR